MWLTLLGTFSIFAENITDFFMRRTVSHKVPASVLGLERPDFTGITGVNKLYSYLKPAESLVTAEELKAHTPFFAESNLNQKIFVTDIGGANGDMTSRVLKALNCPTDRVAVHLIEPSPDDSRIATYQQNLHHAGASSITVTRKKAEVLRELPKSDVIFASHSFYYNSPYWFICSDIAAHFFTRLFCALPLHGVICVLLQSTMSAQNKLGTHETLEDHIYPLVDGVAHARNDHYANAEMFALALNFYQKLYLAKFQQPAPISIHTKTIETTVPIGRINTTPDHQGCYPQSSEVNELLTFYLKGHKLEELAVAKQESIVRLLQEQFTGEDGITSVQHVNKVFCVTVDKPFPQSSFRLPDSARISEEEPQSDNMQNRVPTFFYS